MYLMRIALQHGEVSIVGSTTNSLITIEVPRSYQMLEDGVAKLVEKFMTPISEEEQGKSEETVAVEKTDSVGTDDLTEI